MAKSANLTFRKARELMYNCRCRVLAPEFNCLQKKICIDIGLFLMVAVRGRASDGDSQEPRSGLSRHADYDQQSSPHVKRIRQNYESYTLYKRMCVASAGFLL